MYAGELIFILIAVMYSANAFVAALGVPLQLVWAIFHILVIALQAFVFYDAYCGLPEYCI